MTELAIRDWEREIDRFFEEFTKPWFEDWFEPEEYAYPAVDILKAKDHYRLVAELPGISEKDLNVEIDNCILTIKGTRKKPELKDVTWLRRERCYGEFIRRFELPEDVDTEKIEAKFKDGILEIVLPIKETSKPKEVRIEVH